jgi:hypothetical protein
MKGALLDRQEGVKRQAREREKTGKKGGCKMTGKGADGDKQGGEKKAKGVVKR